MNSLNDKIEVSSPSKDDPKDIPANNPLSQESTAVNSDSIQKQPKDEKSDQMSK